MHAYVFITRPVLQHSSLAGWFSKPFMTTCNQCNQIRGTRLGHREYVIRCTRLGHRGYIEHWLSEIRLLLFGGRGVDHKKNVKEECSSKHMHKCCRDTVTTWHAHEYCL